MKHCEFHPDVVLTYRAGLENSLFCKECEKPKIKVGPVRAKNKKWWKFW